MTKRILICILLSLVFLTSCFGKDRKDRRFANNINALLLNDNVKLNSSLDDAIVYEYGQSSAGSVSYDSLPKADECNGVVIRYFWLRLYKSKFLNRVYAFFNSKGLSDRILSDSYIVYCYHNNKLNRISLRIFTENPKDISLFYAALGQDMDLHPKGFITQVGDTYYATGSSLKTVGIEIAILNQDGYNICTNDWWHKN